MCIPALALMAAAVASAQSGDWQKSYAVSGKASLAVSTGDASVDVHSCGACRAVQVRVEWRDRKSADYTINEFQSADHVNFELKEKPLMGFHFSMGNHQEPHVTVETPTAIDLDARTSDGGLRVDGLQGSLELHTSDGSVDVADVVGSLRLTASDGAIKIHNVTGTLESRSSDGAASIEGKFTALQVHTSDGSLDLTMSEGSQLKSSSRIETSDGRVTIHLPSSLSADLDIHTGDGQLNCKLPLTVEGYNSAHTSGHNLRGRLNAGGVPLAIHTGDGNVTIAAL